jgi:hypothetical protein
MTKNDVELVGFQLPFGNSKGIAVPLLVIKSKTNQPIALIVV